MFMLLLAGALAACSGGPAPRIEETTPTPALPGVLSPLRLQDLEATGELSDTELACIGDLPETMAQVLAWQGPEARDELRRLIACLSDETLSRLFLSGLVAGPEPLSVKTSDCVRAVFAVIDPQEAMSSGIEEDPQMAQRARASSIAVATTVTACLTDEEWERATPGIQIGSQEWAAQERADQRCLMEALGGPGKMAEAMRAEDEDNQKMLAEAAEDCAEEIGPVPGETPASTATPEPNSIVPLDPDDSPGLLSRLSQEERNCITDVGLLADFWSRHPFLDYVVDYEGVAQQLGCLGDETLLDLHLANLVWYFQDLGGEFKADTASCIQDGLKEISLGTLIHEAHTAEPRFVREMYTAFLDLTIFYCLSEEESALAASDSGITTEEYDGMVCTVDAFGGLDGMNKEYRNTGTEDFTEMLMTNLYDCPGR